MPQRSRHGLPVSGAVKVLLLVGGTALLAASLIGLGVFNHRNEEHARFYHAGKTVNAFLKDYCAAFEAAHAAGDPQPLLTLYDDAYTANRGALTWGPELRAGDAVYQLLEETPREETPHQETPTGTEGAWGLDELRDEIARGLQDFADFDGGSCKILLIEDLELNAEIPRRVELTAKLHFNGTAADENNSAFQDRLLHRLELVNQAADYVDWRIAGDAMVEGFRVRGDRAALAAVDPAALGIDFVHRRDPRLDKRKHRDQLHFGVIEHADGGIAAVDVNGDFRPDLFLGDGVESRFYVQRLEEDGGFSYEDVTAASGLGGLNGVRSALFADFDNDGDRDLFVGRYLLPNLYFEHQGNDGAGIPLFVNVDVGLGDPLTTSSATLLDFDRDGWVDLYVAAFGNAFEAFPRLPFYATNGVANRLYRNLEGKGFEDVTAASGTGDNGWSLAVASADLNGDGWPDLMVANDFGRKSLFLNNGDGTFRESAKDAGVLDFSGGMGVALADFDDDGDVDIYTSNIYSNQRWFGEEITIGQYMRNVARTRWALADLGEYLDVWGLLGNDWPSLGQQIGEGNSLFRNNSTGTSELQFEELHNCNAERVGWGWSVAFLDADNDSHLDIYAANGWISNKPETDL